MKQALAILFHWPIYLVILLSDNHFEKDWQEEMEEHLKNLKL